MDNLLEIVRKVANEKKGVVASDDGECKIFLLISNGLNRMIKVWGTEFLVFFTFSEDRPFTFTHDDRFYEAINMVNDEVVSFSIEYDPEQNKIMLKSSVIYVPGIDIHKAIDYFENMHNKYFNVIFEMFSDLPEDITNFSAKVKEEAKRRWPGN
jgi:hypothetical protein